RRKLSAKGWQRAHSRSPAPLYRRRKNRSAQTLEPCSAYFFERVILSAERQRPERYLLPRTSRDAQPKDPSAAQISRATPRHFSHQRILGEFVREYTFRRTELAESTPRPAICTKLDL